jgi:hypothetical protein
MRFQPLLSRLGKLEPAIKSNSCGPSFEGLSEAEMDEQIAHWIRDFESDGIQPYCLHKVDPAVCDSCSGNFRNYSCYTWLGDEFRVGSPVDAEGL